MKTWNGLYPISNYMRMWRPTKKKKVPPKLNLLSKKTRKYIKKAVEKAFRDFY